MRLLFCDHCKSIEEVPDFEGHPSQDSLLEDLIHKHNVRDPMAHGGAQLKASPMRLVKIEPEVNSFGQMVRTSNQVWAQDREKVIRQLNEANKKVGFASWVTEAHNTYAEDALRCFNDHHRPKEGCIDYWSDKKRIGRPTAEGRQAVKDSYKLGEKDPHLCQWCPVHTYVTTQIRFRQGQYKTN